MKINKQIVDMGEWLNHTLLDCDLWLDKNQDSTDDKIIWHTGYKAALEIALDKLEQISGLTGIRR